MNYRKTTNIIQQSPELALRQEQADSQHSPQVDEGSLEAAYEAVREQHFDGSSHEQQR